MTLPDTSYVAVALDLSFLHISKQKWQHRGKEKKCSQKKEQVAKVWYNGGRGGDRKGGERQSVQRLSQNAFLCRQDEQDYFVRCLRSQKNQTGTTKVEVCGRKIVDRR